VKKKTRRGSRGGKNRKKPAGTAGAAKPVEAEAEATAEPEAEKPEKSEPEKKVTIHLPADDLGRPETAGDEVPADAPSENGAATPAKKKTRRGSRGGKNRRKRTAATAGANGAEPAAAAVETDEPETVEAVEAVAVEEPSTNGAPEDEWGYVPMSEWVDELES
jgi:hypothetical protein